MNRCVPVVSASSDLPQKYWSTTYGRAKDHVRKNRRQNYPQTVRPRKAVVSLQIIAIGPNGSKVILVIALAAFSNNQLRTSGGRPVAWQSIALMGRHGVTRRIWTGPEAPAWKRRPGMARSIAGPVSNLCKAVANRDRGNRKPILGQIVSGGWRGGALGGVEAPGRGAGQDGQGEGGRAGVPGHAERRARQARRGCETGRVRV